MAPIIKSKLPATEIYKTLKYLFRDDNIVVRHKLGAGETRHEPLGTAALFLRNSFNQYAKAVSGWGSYDRLSRYSDYCFISTTCIPTLKGDFTIKQLMEMYPNGEKFPVYCYDRDKKRITVGLAHHPRWAKKDNVYKITFDDGTFLITTKDHRFLMRNGEYKQLQEIEVGQKVMPFYRNKYKLKDRSNKNYYSRIYPYKNEKNTRQVWCGEHRIIAEWQSKKDLLPNEIVHHKDFNSLNNDPNNLEVMDEAAHRAYHGKLTAEHNKLMWQDKEFREKFSKEHSKFMTENNPAYRYDLDDLDLILEACKKLDYDQVKVAENLETSTTALNNHIKKHGYKSWSDFKLSNFGQLFKTNKGEKHPRWLGFNFDDVLQAVREGNDNFCKLARHFDTNRTSVKYRCKQNGINNMGELKNLAQATNHTVVSIEFIGREDVYNITVDGHHNFVAIDVNSPFRKYDENWDVMQSGVIITNSEMESDPIIHGALNIYADEVTSEDADGKILKISSSDENIKRILEELFFEILNIKYFLWGWVRSLCKYGDFFLLMDHTPQNGIINVIPIPVNECEREENFSKEDPFAVRFKWVTQGGNLPIAAWNIRHFRLLGNESFNPYGTSLMDGARRIWRQLQLVEDAMMIYRIIRAPEKRVFRIEVGNTPAELIPQVLQQQKDQLKRNLVVSSDSSLVDKRYNVLPIAWNSVIPLLDGRNITIKELAQEYEQGKINYVYSVDPKTHLIKPGKVSWCGETRKQAQAVKVVLDDGSYVVAAPDHPFMTRDGNYINAGDLKAGQSLMPFYRKRDLLENSTKNDKDYELTYVPAWNYYEYTHRLVCQEKDNLEIILKKNNLRIKVGKGRVIHHKDFNRFNNSPDNLEILSWHDHYMEHARIGKAQINKYNNSLDHIKSVEAIKKYNNSEQHKEDNKKRSKYMKEHWADPKRKLKAQKNMSRNFDEKCFELLKQEVINLKQYMNMEDFCKWLKENDNEFIKYFAEINNHNKRKSTKNLERHFLTDSIRKFDFNSWNDFIETFNINLLQQKKEKASKHMIAFNKENKFERNEKGQITSFKNHKVVEVIVLDEPIDMFCMTVDEWHNFAVGSCPKSGIQNSQVCGIIVKNSAEDDYFLPKRGEVGSTIEQLAGGQFTGDIEDIQYLQSKLFAAIGIPKPFLQYDESISSKAVLSAEDIRFAKTVRRIQQIVVGELNKIAMIHLVSMGFVEPDDYNNFELQLSNPSIIAEIQNLELWRTRLEIAGNAMEILPKDFIYKNFFKLSDIQIEEMYESLRLDAMQRAELEAIPQTMAAQAGAGEAEKESGDQGSSEPEQAPEEAPEASGGELTAGYKASSSKLLGEKEQDSGLGSGKNKYFDIDTEIDDLMDFTKSKGLHAYEDPVAHTFNRKKNTLSDPFDVRGIRRLKLQNSESYHEDKVFKKQLNELKRFQAKIEQIEDNINIEQEKKE